VMTGIAVTPRTAVTAPAIPMTIAVTGGGPRTILAEALRTATTIRLNQENLSHR
jgi:hypothetical protein